jgi:Kef-type K+ transport system membrane component KefB/nucleotide-binding universal stress UspA family protein
MVDGIAQIGVLLLLLLAGMETDLKLVRRIGRAAASVSFTGILVPFVCGFVAGEFLLGSLLPEGNQRLVGSLFLGTALSISSVKIVATVIREMEFMRRNVGQIILASAVIDDTLGWIIIAVIFSLAKSGTIDTGTLTRSVIGTLVFLAVSLTIGRRVVFWIIRWANDTLVSDAPVIAVIIILMGAMALTTQAIGVHTVLGAFVAGILVGESPILTRRIDQQLRGLISGLFMPVFFGTAGLSADLTILSDTRLLLLTGALVLIASVGKFAGAFAGGELGGLSRRESLALACGMNARGSTEVIIATIGLSMGMLSHDLFTMILAMAIVTTMAMPPMLRWALARLPMNAEEKARLEREEYEARGFLPNVERLLLAVDDSPNGKFAAHIPGILAGGRGRPTTVLHVDGDDNGGIGDPGRKEAADSADTQEKVVKAGAKTTTEVGTKEQGGEAKHAHVDVTRRDAAASPEEAIEEAIAEEARKGYDLMVIGLESMVDAAGGFHESVERVISSFTGPVAVVAGRGMHLEHPTDGRFRILVPVSGTEASHRAAEVAVALARASRTPITALYVAHDGASVSRRHEEAILKDVTMLADRYDARARTRVRIGNKPDEAVLREAALIQANLIVMGVHRRPGETLYFGDNAAAVLAKSKVSILFVST